MAHTQGPWRIGEPRDGFIGNVLADNPRRLLAQVTVQDGEQTLANAHLIAAAPDMLVVLEWIADQYGIMLQLQRVEDECGDNICGNIRAAIAKARGEA
jgi:hypothetical protein